MKEKGTVGTSFGFTAPEDGWHVAVIQEGLNLKVNENSGKESFYIPMQIEEDGDDNGKKVAMFINTRDENGSPYKSVEKRFADIIANLGLEEAFNKKFPGDVSYLDNPVIDAMKIKLPGNMLQIKTQSKDNRVNIVAIDIKGADHSKEKVAKEKKGGAGAAAPTKPAEDLW